MSSNNIAVKHTRSIEHMEQDQFAQTSAHSQAMGEGRIPLCDRTLPLPLSYGQQRLWFLEKLQPESSAYNAVKAYRVIGPLDVELLRRALNEIVCRHESLRTTFAEHDGEVVQVVHDLREIPLPVVELCGVPVEKHASEIVHRAAADAALGFDLANDLPLRATLLRCSADQHVLFLSMHHVATDGWSLRVFWKELSALYAAFADGSPSPLPDLPVQYADYAVWQRERLQGERLHSQLAWWQRELAGAPPALELPTDRPRPAIQTFRGAYCSAEIPTQLAIGLSAVARRHGATLFMTLLAAFQTLLARITGQPDVVVGIPVAGRTMLETEGLIGLFVNLLALRTDLADDPSFSDLLRRVRKTALGVYAHQDFPFEQLVDTLRLPRDLSRNPLVQVMFNMLNLREEAVDLSSELKVNRLAISRHYSKFDLTLYASKTARGISLSASFNADLFDQNRIVGLLEQYVLLLEQAVQNPENQIGSYSLVTPAARRLLPDPGSELEEPRFPPVTSSLLNWAEETPDQIAVSQGEHSWTYHEVGELARQLARLLHARGIEPGDVVTVQGPRSFGTIVSAIGVLLTGGVLMLVDEDLPVRRKALMLQEAGPKAIIFVGADPQACSWCGTMTNIHRFTVESATGQVVGFDDESRLPTKPLPELSPDDPAYLFFTSGTTGVPKEIVGCHKGLSHFLHWQRTEFAIGPNDRVAQLTSLSFDVVLRDIFLPLTSGGTLCLPETIDSADAARVLPWLQQEQITVLHAVPSLASFWLDHGATDFALPALRYVFFAGEPLTGELVGRWRQAVSNKCTIINLYGPTETTLAKCYYRVPSNPLPGVQPVGNALPQTQAMVFAGRNRLCGIGEAGEIVLRTPFRTLGYLRPTDGTGFVRNPFREDETDWLYFTGDRGRFRPDGTLEILGRLDDQVKIHGVRVEPAEVAAILSGHPAVRTCVVLPLVREKMHLAVYVALREPSGASIALLRKYLAERFPITVAAVTFMLLDEIPLTSSGKVDRQALPDPAFDGLELAETYVAPRTPIEELLASIWCDALGAKQVGIHDNFFELGGHSLLATRLVSSVRRAFDVELPLRTIFETPTIEDLALYLLEKQASESRLDGVDDVLRELESISEENAESRLRSERPNVEDT